MLAPPFLVVTEDPPDVFSTFSFKPSGPPAGRSAAGRPLFRLPVTCSERFFLVTLATGDRRSAGDRGLLLDAAAGRHLADAEDDEFRRLHRREADLDDQLAGVDDLGRVGLLVALDVEGLLRATCP